MLKNDGPRVDFHGQLNRSVHYEVTDEDGRTVSRSMARQMLWPVSCIHERAVLSCQQEARVANPPFPVFTRDLMLRDLLRNPSPWFLSMTLRWRSTRPL